MAITNSQTNVSLSIQADTHASVSHRSYRVKELVNVSLKDGARRNIFYRGSRIAVSSGSSRRKQTTKREQIKRSYKVSRSVPQSSVSNSIPPDVPTSTTVEEQSDVSVYTPPAPPPEPKIIEHYNASSSKDELVIDSVDNISSFMRKTAISNLRPELLGSLDWIPGVNNIGYPTSIEQLIDVRWTMRQLIVENVEKTISTLQSEDESGTFEQILADYQLHDENIRNIMDTSYSVVSSLELAKAALDIKDNEESLTPIISRFAGEKTPKTTLTDSDLSIRSLFINNLGFSENGYSLFSNSKILNQILSDLSFAVYRHSPMLISENNFDRLDDTDSLSIEKTVIPRHRDYSLKPHQLEYPKFDPKKYSKYSSFLASLPINDEDKIKVLTTMLSRELTLSAGLGLTEAESLGKRFGSPQPTSVSNALGIPRNNILDDVKADGSIGDYILINEVGDGATKDNRSILPFETRAFVDRRGRRAVPGSVALVDSITKYGEMFDTSAYESFSKEFESVTNDAVDFIEKLLNLEDEEYSLQPQTIFSKVLTGVKGSVDKLTNSYSTNQQQAMYASILNLCRSDQELRYLMFKYVLELRDIFDELETDTSETTTGSRAMPQQRKKQLESLDRSARISATEDSAQNKGGVGWEDISRNLSIDAIKAKRLSLTSRNPLSYTAMKIAKRVYELAEEFPAGTSPTNTRDITTLGKEAVYSTLMKASHNISGTSNVISTIINTVLEMEQTASALASRNNGSGTYILDSGLTKYNKWCEDSFFMITFEIFVNLFSKYVESSLYRSGDTLYILYDSEKNLDLSNAISAVEETRLSDSVISQNEQADVASSDVNDAAISEGALSQSSALESLSSSSASVYSDLQTFVTELEQEIKFIHQMNSVLQSVSSTLSIASDQLKVFFDIEDNTALKELAAHSLGNKFLQNLSSQQLLLHNAIRYKKARRENDNSYLPGNQTVNAYEVAALRSLLKEPKMGGRTGDNIRVLSVGIPAGLLSSLLNPPYTIGDKSSTELPEHRNVVEVNVYKRDLEHEDIIFKPKTYRYDLSLFLLPNAFDNLDLESSDISSLEGVYNKVAYSQFSSLIDGRQPEDVESNEAVNTQTAVEIQESNIYGFLGTNGTSTILSNHLIDRLLKTYYQLVFGLEIDESTFMYDDSWLDIFVDDDAKQLLQLGEAAEATTWWVRNGSVPIENLILEKSIEGESFKKVVTADDAKPWMKDRVFLNQEKANKFWEETEERRKFEAGIIKDEKKVASASSDVASRPTVYDAKRRYRIPPMLNSTDLTSFRALTSATLFNSYGTLMKFIAPKLFDRVFMMPVDPDDFEIDIEATSENFGGDQILNKDYFTEISEDVQGEDGRVIRKLKPRRKGENYSSFNDFFITVSTPDVESV